jgi:glutamine synthetase
MSAKKTSDDWLMSEVTAGRIDTVALSFADRLGAWRGKRVPAKDFVEHGSTTLGFCDGMIVCDIQCGVIEETPFSNFSTGYPDLHVTLDPREARPMGWRPREAYVFGVPSDRHGTSLSVAPSAVLQSVLRRLEAVGLVVTTSAELSGAFFDSDAKPNQAFTADEERHLPFLWLNALTASWIPVRYCHPGFDPGSFRLGIDELSPLELAQAIVVAKGAAKELARVEGGDAIFMTRRPGGAEPALLQVTVTLKPFQELSTELLECLLGEARPLLYPSVNAMRMTDVPVVLSTRGEVSILTVSASAEADSATVLATVLAAVGAALDGVQTPGSRIDALSRSAQLLESYWLRDWLGEPFLENSIPLFEHEAALFASAVTDWEIERYWGVA